MIYGYVRVSTVKQCTDVQRIESEMPKVRVARKYRCNVSTLYDWLRKQEMWP